MGRLSINPGPNLADYYEFYGESAKGELKLEYDQCEKNNLIPPETNQRCQDYVKNREARRNQAKSLFLNWLKIKLPSSPDIQIFKVEKIRGEASVEYDRIYVLLDRNMVEFYRTVGDKINIRQFGRISVSKINGVSVEDILANDLKNKSVTEKSPQNGSQ
ncbi:MAG: hypothetical protein PHE84_11775 [bacterium]|nr:hypothetical protein [bacterium]